MSEEITMPDFIAKHKIKSKSYKVLSNPNMDDRDMDHYRVYFTRGKKRLTVSFSKGYGHKGAFPETGEVLDCLASDSASVENAQSFEDWASDLGYDTDSRNAEKTFKACEKLAEKLKKFLGDDAYEELLWNTERM